MRGWAELSLLAAVVAACWLRTPVGAIAHNGLASLRGEPTRDLLAHFDTRLPDHLEDTLSEAASIRSVATSDLPPGWSPALHLAVVTHLGQPAADALLEVSMEQPERALETWAVGEAQRDRAIRRARAAGALEPERYQAHRRFLPEREIARADRAVSEVMSLAVALDLSWPVEPGLRLGSPFGWRISPISHKRAFHNGLDIGLRQGHPIRAAAEGTVTRSGFDPVSGNAVVIAHGHGVSTAYCHGSALRVGKGERVDRQALIMDAGSTGNSTGPHLHYVVRIDGRAVDPAIFHPSQGRPLSDASFQPPKGAGG
jgi:murein DD-endopeptidase